MNKQETLVYDPSAVEKKWQARWLERGTNSVDIKGAKKPFYSLMMFPYPSAEGLHVGNMFAFTGNDIFARFQRLQGYDVFEPLGYDAFGIHSENYALKIGTHPAQLIPRSIANFRRQLDRAGLMVDWRYGLSTTDPSYYKWTQWLFVQLFKQGLAYKKEAAVNWCPSCKTVLANEQVVGGACERCGTSVEQRLLNQWFFRISDYAGRLLDNLEKIDWSETTKQAQRNWIGKSVGAKIEFEISNDPSAFSVTPSGRPSALRPARPEGSLQNAGISSGSSISVFTTRPDTIMGVTFMVLAPEHPLVDVITTEEQWTAVSDYREHAAKKDIVARKTNKEKTGVFTGAYAVNPANGEKVPVWISDYVLMDYGTGAIMAVPGHDERDEEFAKQFDLPIIPLTDEQMANAPAVGERVVNYRLHDWCISRQRYWGPPIPIIYCDDCGPVTVPEKDLPVLLPEIEDIRPDDSGISPLARHEEWYRVPCPDCGKTGRRETDVSDTFLDSAWYFLRYPNVGNDDVAFNPEITKKWLPVDSYIGGNEHAVLHLMYSRFVTMALKDGGLIDFEEPFTKFRAHGLIIREGAKMSKSRGNVVNPDEYIDQWGADAFRTYLMFLGPFEEGGDFQDKGISGVKRFLDRLWVSVDTAVTDGEPDAEVMRKLHQTIKKCGDDIARLSYNTAIAAMMEYMNALRKGDRTAHRAEVEPVVQLVAPFAPHIAEELWEQLGHTESVFEAGWPRFDASLAADDTVALAVQVNGKMRGTLNVPRDVTQDAAFAAAKSDAAISKFLVGEPKKVIFVPGRLINIVV